MLEIGTSGLMSGEGNRATGTAPLLNSTPKMHPTAVVLHPTARIELKGGRNGFDGIASFAGSRAGFRAPVKRSENKTANTQFAYAA